MGIPVNGRATVTASMPRGYDWLPDAHLTVAESLGHVDATIADIAAHIRRYYDLPALGMQDRLDGDQLLGVVSSVAPLPAAVRALTENVCNDLRSTLERALFTEVEKRHIAAGDEPMSERQCRAVEMPACRTEGQFHKWLAHKVRATMAGFAPDSDLSAYVCALQPFQATDPATHPLARLVSYTNLAKHRKHLNLATMVVAVRADLDDAAVAAATTGEPARRLARPEEVRVDFPGMARPVVAGDVLSSVPAGTVAALDVWPSVALQRPNDNTWQVLLRELGALEQWVRTVAIPLLVTGRHDVTPLPPQIDIGRSYPDLRPVLETAGSIPAADRFVTQLQADIARENLPGLLAAAPGGPSIEDVREWLRALGDGDILTIMAQLDSANLRGPFVLHEAAREVTARLRAGAAVASPD